MVAFIASLIVVVTVFSYTVSQKKQKQLQPVRVKARILDPHVKNMRKRG
jgi:hypothetical protein